MGKFLTAALIASMLALSEYPTKANDLKDYSGIVNGLPVELKYDAPSNTNILKINIKDRGYSGAAEYIDKGADLTVDEVKINIRVTDKLMFTGGQSGGPAIYINKNLLATDYVDVKLYTSNKELIERVHQKTFDNILTEIRKNQSNLLLEGTNINFSMRAYPFPTPFLIGAKNTFRFLR